MAKKAACDEEVLYRGQLHHGTKCLNHDDNLFACVESVVEYNVAIDEFQKHFRSRLRCASCHINNAVLVRSQTNQDEHDDDGRHGSDQHDDEEQDDEEQ